MAKKKARKKEASARAQARARALPELGIIGSRNLSCVVRERVSTRCTPLDAVMGGPTHLTEEGEILPVPSDGTLATQWGAPVGRIIEVIGGYSTGKTLFVENLAAEVQALGGEVSMGLSEATVDPVRMRAIGVDTEKIRFNEVETIPQAFDWIEAVLEHRKPQAGTPALVSLDTVGGLHPSDDRPGSGAREVREGLRRVSNPVAQKQVILVLVNQIAVTFDQFDYEPATPFGAGVRYHSSIRLYFKGMKRLTEDDIGARSGLYDAHAPIGIMPIATCLKNRTAPPFRKCRAPMRFDGSWDEAYAIWSYLHTRRGCLESRKPYTKEDVKQHRAAQEEPQNYGDVWTLKMPEPVSCFYHGWPQLLAENPAAYTWLKDQCYRLALRGFNPIGSE